MFSTKWRKLGAGVLVAGTLATGGTVAADRAINPYQDKGTHYELPIVSEIPQGEHVEIAKDHAAMTLKGWNDEYAITITPQVPGVFGAADGAAEFDTPASRPLFSTRMDFKTGDVTAYIEPKKGTTNEFDIDFTLDAKPDTNAFNYKIEGAEDFDFSYQPELTPEEVAEGAERPPNVVGSYAVYSKDKANHLVGSTNYAIGKVAHIYRPKASDANGNETWAELSYAKGILTVTVPQSFIDSAAYPMKVDPTFGYTTQGATAAAWTNGYTYFFQLDGLSPAGTNTLTNISFCIQAALTSTQTKYALYAESGSLPAGRLAVDASSWAFGSTAKAFYMNPVAMSFALVASTQYWVGIADTDSTTKTFYDAAGSKGERFRAAVSVPDPAGTTSDLIGSSVHPSAYATYTSSGSAAPSDDTSFDTIDD